MRDVWNWNRIRGVPNQTFKQLCCFPAHFYPHFQRYLPIGTSSRDFWLLVMHCKSGSSLAFSKTSLGFSFLKCAELLPLSCFLKFPNFIVLFSSLTLFVLLVSSFFPSFLLFSLPSFFFPFLPLFMMFYMGSQKEAEVNMFNEHV